MSMSSIAAWVPTCLLAGVVTTRSTKYSRGSSKPAKRSRSLAVERREDRLVALDTEHLERIESSDFENGTEFLVFAIAVDNQPDVRFFNTPSGITEVGPDDSVLEGFPCGPFGYGSYEDKPQPHGITIPLVVRWLAGENPV